MEFRFKYRGLLILGFINSPENKSLILIPGLPQYITKNHDLVKNLLNIGYNVFIPQYHGSFDSEGVFSLVNCIKTVENCLCFVKQGDGQELFNNVSIAWNRDNIVVIGYSFGALPALACKNKIGMLVLLNPFVNFNVHKKNGGESLEQTFRFINRAFPKTYNFKASDLLKELKDFNYDQLLKKSDTTIKIVYGLKDKSIPIQEIKWLDNNLTLTSFGLNTGHTSRLGINELRKILE